GRDVLVHAGLVGQAVLAVLELQEAGDVGARQEGLAAGSAQGDDAHVLVVGDLLGDAAEVGPHLGGQGVQRLRAVEGDFADVADLLVLKLAVVAHWAGTFACSAVSRPRSASSRRISSLCSPSSGAWWRTCCGVRLSFTGKPRAL